MMQPATSLSERDVTRFLEYIELARKALLEMDDAVVHVLDPQSPATTPYVDAGNSVAVVLSEMHDRLTAGSWWAEEGVRDDR
jgi:hypothetical protein